MPLSKKIKKLYYEKNKIDIKLDILKNQLRAKNSGERNKENRKKKKLAKIFLTSNYSKNIDKYIFSMYEIYTIGGLVIMNNLNMYKSSVLLASYNQIINDCYHNQDFKKNIIQQGEKSYMRDRKIKKDIEQKLYFINGIFIFAKEYILKSDINKLDQIGNSQFIKIAKAKIQIKYQHLISSLEK